MWCHLFTTTGRYNLTRQMKGFIYPEDLFPCAKQPRMVFGKAEKKLIGRAFCTFSRIIWQQHLLLEAVHLNPAHSYCLFHLKGRWLVWLFSSWLEKQWICSISWDSAVRLLCKVMDDIHFPRLALMLDVMRQQPKGELVSTFLAAAGCVFLLHRLPQPKRLGLLKWSERLGLCWLA